MRFATGGLMRACLAILLLVGSAHAQVHKCPGPGGQIIYSQAPCNDGQVIDSQKPRSPAEQSKQSAKQQREIDRATRAAAPDRAPAAEGAPAVILGQPSNGKCPSEEAVRDMETSASAKFAKGDTELAKRRATAARECRDGGAPYDARAVAKELDAERDKKAAERRANRSLHCKNIGSGDMLCN